MLQEFRAVFVRKQIRTEKVSSFIFRPTTIVDFLPGQFAQVIFNEKDRSDKALNKYLSFSSRPGKPEFEVTKKISESDFSRRLQGLKTGDEVLFKAPMGNCVLPLDTPKVGFLIGGIGITPVISILDHIAYNKLATDVCLLYSNWTSHDIAYKAELDRWSQENKNIRVVHTLVECHADDQACFSGVITQQFVEQQMPDYKERLIFIFGPPGMVNAMQANCKGLGCLPERVKAENFVGY